MCFFCGGGDILFVYLLSVGYFFNGVIKNGVCSESIETEVVSTKT